MVDNQNWPQYLFLRVPLATDSFASSRQFSIYFKFIVHVILSYIVCACWTVLPVRSLTTMSACIPRERHPEYYFADGTVHFLILETTQHTLYKLYPGLLSLRSPVLQTLLSLPRQSGSTEGTCDGNPIILYGVDRRDFDYLLTFLSGGYAGEENHQEYLISVLKMSAFFDIREGFQYAVAELNRLTPLSPAHKLQLGRQYRVDQWITPAFQDLMSRPLSSITRVEASQMGLDFFYLLAHTKTKIEENYRAIAFTEPSFMPSVDCEAPAQCTVIWKDEWWNGIARHLLHPEVPTRGEDIIALVDETDIPGICTNCKEMLVLKIRQSPALRYENRMLVDALRDAMDIQTDKHIRASFTRY